MAHIVCITNGLTGLSLASFEMLRRLRADGHRITYMAPSFAMDAVTREGLPFEELPDLEAGTDGDLASFAERIRALAPDLALIDTELPEAVLSSQAAGLKTVLLNTWMSIWRHPGLPPLHRPIQPGVGLRGSPFGLRLAWTRHLMTRRFMDVARKVKHGNAYRVARLRTYADQIGFPHREEFDFSNWLLPFSFKSLPIFVLHAHEFEFPHTPRDHVHYVGPMVNPERADTLLNAEDHGVIDAVLAKRRANETRLVFGGFGSFFTADPKLLKNVFTAIASRPDWDLIVPLGETFDRTSINPVPANVHIVAWAPQLTLLGHADVAIVHGGINTIDECVYTETPMLAFSGGITDMPGNIARLVHHGLGVEGDCGQDDPRQIVECLDRLMTDTDVARALAKHRLLAERYRRERIVEQIIDRFLEGDLAVSAKPLTPSHRDDRQPAASTL